MHQPIHLDFAKNKRGVSRAISYWDACHGLFFSENFNYLKQHSRSGTHDTPINYIDRQWDARPYNEKF